jgi:hypothetical protein
VYPVFSQKVRNRISTIKRTLRNKTRKDTMLKFYKVMAVPVLMYGSESWSMNRADRRRVEAAEKKYLRYVAGYTLKYQVRSDNIRQQLGIFNLNHRIQQKKKYWHEHILRMDPRRITQQILHKPIGYQDIGRPIRRWEDDL